MEWVDSVRAEHEVYPHSDQVFAAFDLTSYDDTRVVILGQDPYPSPGLAHGLCCSVPDGVLKPRSLINIFKELESDLGIAHLPTATRRAGRVRGCCSTRRVAQGALSLHP